LTGLIAPRVKSLICIELDTRLSEKLRENIRVCNVAIINENFLDYNISSDLKNLKIIANLPYYVATKIIQTILPQKLVAKAVFYGTKKKSACGSLPRRIRVIRLFVHICQYYANCKACFTCSPKVFYPEPEIDSVDCGIHKQTFPST